MRGCFVVQAQQVDPADRAFAPSLTRRGIVRAGIAGLTALVGGRALGSNAAARSQPTASVSGSPVAIGAYIPDAFYDPAVVFRFSAAIRRQPDFLVDYDSWADGDFGDAELQGLINLEHWGITPVLAWDPYDPSGPTIDQPKYKLSNIIRGDFDAYVDSWANGLAAHGKPVFLNFGHEMNGNWYPWGIGVNGNQPGEFITAWRHVHDRFTAAGASNVIWVWTPNQLYDGVPATVEEVYPGDDYVDWFGTNGFNWGANIHWESCDCQSAWQTFNKIFETTYQHLTKLADKPILIGEIGCSEVGGDKAAWISDALVDQIPKHYPQIRAVSWFNKVATGLDTIAPGDVEPTTAAVDWRVTSSRAALNAFSNAVNEPYYQGSLLALTRSLT
jgi:mannan endo-1,4-beta-mannosidase